MARIQQVVADKTAPTSVDLFVHDILVGPMLGHSVTYVSDEDAENTTGFDGVVICESCIGTTLAAKYDTAPVPVVTHEFAWIDDARLVSTQSIGSEAAGITAISVQSSTHPIMNGYFGAFSGTVTISSAADTVVYTDTNVVTVASGVTVIAQDTVNANEKYVLACEAGATLNTGTAPAKRGALGWPFNSGSGTLIDPNSIAIIKNAYLWAFGTTLLPPVDLNLVYLRKNV